MLKSFGTRNFRCLEDFELHDLARVNLIVGDNDTGKTVLLEALFGHLAQANALKFVTLKAFRQTTTSPDETFWQEFFTGFDDSKEIDLWSVDSRGNERRSKIAVGQDTQIPFASPPASGALVETPGKPGVQPGLFRPLRVEYKDGTMEEPSLNEVVFDPSKGVFAQTHKSSPDLRGYYFSTAGPPGAESVAHHLSELIVNKQQSFLIEFAKVIDERILNLTVASPKGISEVFVDLGEAQLHRLSLLGSGVVRALGIASAIPAYTGGVLLVDEIETGIYYKRLADFWKNIYEMAKRFDVQLIATTHSAECTRFAIETVTADLQDADPLHIYRLVRGKRSPIPYEGENLRSALEFGAEVR